MDISAEPVEKTRNRLKKKPQMLENHQKARSNRMFEVCTKRAAWMPPFLCKLIVPAEGG